MDLSKIMTISGKSGLYKVISETRTGILTESLTDGRKMPVFATDRSSLLEDINIFTTDGEMPLKEVLWKIHEHEGGDLSIDIKADPGKTKAMFEEILPNYDRDRVYFSDIKKVFSWYRLLFEKGMISKPESSEDAESDTSTAAADDAAQSESEPEVKQDVASDEHTDAAEDK